MRGGRVAAVLAVAVLAGCGGQGGAPVAAPDTTEQVRAQARAALTRYDEAVARAGEPRRFIPVEQLTGLRGSTDEKSGGLGAGLAVATGPLPGAPAATGRVRWADGSTEAVPLIGAGEALAQMSAQGAVDCAGCTPARVTGARLVQVDIGTTRGRATAPAWEFTVEGADARLTRVAVGPARTVVVTPPSWDPYDTPAGIGVESATTTAAGTELTVSLVGSRGPASEPCGADYAAEAVESAAAVVVIVHETRHSADDVCPAIGHARTAVARLARPLGERSVLEVREGRPVPVTITR
ncbi:hypothetical protein [Spirilliplanes yamanashiensis]|uniref:Lipoprotein n=1 Tax=Spirilliplanes yamanashiensis TaxID=42233 RepID=A0A8J3YCU3_9ACTN|nr:hypothetical protein [Spirilliplanes yamanashiensis]MDP9819105.1 hypothetical protein [Spirilliplanes yamanashiensis]GIJ05559.1 hypothetical protein Sya03_49110 [Spirilliplanes yamanashiensis]